MIIRKDRPIREKKNGEKVKKDADEQVEIWLVRIRDTKITQQ